VKSLYVFILCGGLIIASIALCALYVQGNPTAYRNGFKAGYKTGKNDGYKEAEKNGVLDVQYDAEGWARMIHWKRAAVALGNLMQDMDEAERQLEPQPSDGKEI
jgi:flagellar biosynthesis/type III secretory pathway protein FliH